MIFPTVCILFKKKVYFSNQNSSLSVKNWWRWIFAFYFFFELYLSESSHLQLCIFSRGVLQSCTVAKMDQDLSPLGLCVEMPIFSSLFRYQKWSCCTYTAEKTTSDTADMVLLARISGSHEKMRV